eukprot:6093448-Prymnesium_polylepis.3
MLTPGGGHQTPLGTCRRLLGDPTACRRPKRPVPPSRLRSDTTGRLRRPAPEHNGQSCQAHADELGNVVLGRWLWFDFCFDLSQGRWKDSLRLRMGSIRPRLPCAQSDNQRGHGAQAAHLRRPHSPMTLASWSPAPGSS